MPKVVYQNTGEKIGNPWIRYILGRIYVKNKNWMCSVVGPTGSGKTYHAISFCEEISKQNNVYFGIDNIVFSLNELMSLINSAKLQKGSCILFDEPQISISNREFQSRANKVFNYLLTTFRHRNFILMFCTPYEDLLDKTSRKLFHAKFQMMSIDKKHKTSTSKPLEIEYNSQKGKFYNKFLRVVFKPNNKNKFTSQKLKKLTLPLANKRLIKQYEAKKMAFTKDLNLKIEMELDNDNRKKALEGKRKPLTDIQDQVYRLLVKFDWNRKKTAETQSLSLASIHYHIKAIQKKGYPVKKAHYRREMTD